MSAPPGDAASRRPEQGTGPQKIATAAATDTVPEQPVISGIDAAIANSDELQLSGFLDVVEALPFGWTGPAENIFENDHYGLPVDHPNRMGAWVRHAARLGLLERIGYTPARKASRNGSVVAVWRRCRDGE